MLVYSTVDKRYVLDPHYLSIIPLREVYDTDPTSDKKIGEAKLLWIYHMYNPHSPFRDHRNSEKSDAIVRAVFPKAFLDAYETKLKMTIQEAIEKNKEIDELSDTEIAKDGEVMPRKKPKEVFIPKLRLYDPLEEEIVEEAVDWYKDHLTKTPLWAATEAYKEAIYNLSQIIADPESSAQNIRIASTELDTLPLKMEKMRQQAVKDEATTLQVAEKKNIRRGEKVESHSSKRRRAEMTKESTDT